MGLKAGVASVDITPPVGVELCGYGLYLNRKSTGIRDRLYSKALVLSDGENRVAIIANDLIGVMRETTQKARRLIREETGIPEDNIMVACTHTHHGPATVFLRACGRIDEDYLRILPKYIAGAVKMADSNLQDARIGAGKGRLENVSMNRVVKGGLIDPELGVIRVDDSEGRIIALLMNFSCHAVVMPINTLISSDFPGAAASTIERIERGSLGFFLQGACGDINPILVNTGKVEQVGITVAAEALKVGENIRTVENVTVASKVRRVKLPLHVLNAEEIEDIGRRLDEKWLRVYSEWAECMLKSDSSKQWLETEIQVIRIGDIILIAEPSEMFVKFSLEIKKRSPYENTFVVGYANDYVGYIPDEEDYERRGGFGGYAAIMVPILTNNFPFKPDVGRIIADEMIDLIREANES